MSPTVFPSTAPIVVALLLGAIFWCTHSAVPQERSPKSRTAAEANNAAELFAKLKPFLLKNTRVPPRLPAAMETNGAKVYAYVNRATADSYEVTLGFEPNCEGGQACSIGYVAGHKSSRVPRGKRVPLKRGIIGRYTPYVCGAFCGNAVLYWREGGFVYTVAIKGAQKQELIAAVNSAIPDTD